MGAKSLFGLGALSFWLPEIALYAWTGPELNRKLARCSPVTAPTRTWRCFRQSNSLDIGCNIRCLNQSHAQARPSDSG
jgi:hypothetical protein